MTPKEKAIELVGKYSTVLSIQFSKEFALIAVDELYKEVIIFEYGNPILVDKRLLYWEEVKQEIEKL